MNEKQISRIKSKLSLAKSVSILTGAGISAESGVPTFRGKGGLWRSYRAEELATPEAFRRDPELVWEWYNMRREKIALLSPNMAHKALASFEKKTTDFTLITQNVDGLHEEAGSRNILELHGNIWKVRCTGCGIVSENHDLPIDILPRCRECGGLLRPHIVWFGEMLPADIISSAYAALERCDILLVVGTSGVVQPAASMASIARQAGAYVVELNIEKTPNSRVVDEAIAGKAAEILPTLLNDHA
ncbi:MAG: NAD-dependent deacylase [bacterium]|nr:NAD-dependent deacylase [bacterium]